MQQLVGEHGRLGRLGLRVGAVSVAVPPPALVSDSGSEPGCRQCRRRRRRNAANSANNVGDDARANASLNDSVVMNDAC